MDSDASERGRFPVASRARRGQAAVLLALLFASDPAAAQTQQRPARPATPAPAPADPAFEAARATFEALPEPERKAIQDALVWTGDFNAVVSGGFGRRTFEALNAYRTRTKGADPLDPRGRTALLGAGAAARNAARFRIAPDPGSGAVMGVPERLLSKRTTLVAGTRWQSQDGRVTLESRAYPPGGETLDTLFEKAVAPLPSRKVTYKLKRPDVVVITAETGAGLSYIRYAAGPAGVRGFLFGYDKSLAPEVDRLVIAVANAFVPFPEAAAPASPVAAIPSAPARSETGATAAQDLPAAGAGLTVAPGRVLTASAALETCAAPRIGAEPARMLAADSSGLTLLDASGAPAPIRPAVRRDPVGVEDNLIALAPGPDGNVAAPGSAVAGDVVAALQTGSAGAPVLDRSGRLVGLVARYPAAPRRVAGIVPPARLPLIPSEKITAFLAGQGIAEAKTPLDGGPGAVASAVVGIACR
ncbi:serine protease [Methylobacterium sp. E-005]|uniref:serine protease n=1 Tax=Methylobacterium sp. E-005 TaxID=2836549 RepID=UPI001FBA10D0|nr:serine protease [Methylobacterium sp. E-005]MCJ2089878.1 serine protease [Methylobacterium sp. E-005]